MIVVVHGREYAFGPHERSTSGVFNLEPKSYAGFKLKNPSFRFRKSVLIGKTDVGPEEIRAFMDKLAEEYPGNTYQLINKNCNHFSNEACLRLTGKTIPGWVNRLARLGMRSIFELFMLLLLDILRILPVSLTDFLCGSFMLCILLFLLAALV